VDPRAGLDDVEKRKFLTLPGLEVQPPLGRPARGQSLFEKPDTLLTHLTYDRHAGHVRRNAHGPSNVSGLMRKIRRLAHRGHLTVPCQLFHGWGNFISRFLYMLFYQVHKLHSEECADG
jgi:hypothetical protein